MNYYIIIKKKINNMIEFIFNCFDICNQILNYTGSHLVNKLYEIITLKPKLPSFFNLPIKDLNDYYLKKIIDWQIQNGDLLDTETRLISLDIKESAIKEQFKRNIPIGIPIDISHNIIIQITDLDNDHYMVVDPKERYLVDQIAIVIVQEKEINDSYYNYDFRII